MLSTLRAKPTFCLNKIALTRMLMLLCHIVLYDIMTSSYDLYHAVII